MRPLAPAVLLFAVCSSGVVAGCSTAPRVADGRATVVRVVDGDTVVVDVAGRRETVRLIGVDTPETKKPNTPVQCYGPEASAFTTSLLPPGTAVRLERDVEPRDAYDRLLAYVYRTADDLFVNLELVRTGHAVTLEFPPNTTNARRFAAAAADAEQHDRGLWGACPG